MHNGADANCEVSGARAGQLGLPYLLNCLLVLLCASLLLLSVDLIVRLIHRFCAGFTENFIYHFVILLAKIFTDFETQ